MLRTLDARDPGFNTWIAEQSADSSLFDPEIEKRARTVVEAVMERGDAALVEFTKRFDGADVPPHDFAVSAAEYMNAALAASQELRLAVQAAAKNIERFSRRSLRRGWTTRNLEGAKVGEKFDPFRRVGIYIPGGTAPLASTALMTIVLARVAGCPEIVVCTPCDSKGRINPAMLHAIRTAGATEVYRLGGAQAIAAMALGTSTVRRVDKVFGPGNAYVVAAKRMLFGRVALDLLPGPSEVLVLADATAPARYIAADLLAQAEHGSGHERCWLVTPSNAQIQAVRSEMIRQLPDLGRREFIEKAVRTHGWAIRVDSMEDGVEVANRLAPEHCEIHAKNPSRWAKNLTTSGALFLGPYSPTVLGDYVAGPSHTLPTGGAGRSFAGLTVDQFQRRTSVVEYSAASARKAMSAVQIFASMEGLDAHGRSLSIRFESKRSGSRRAKRARA